MAICKYCNLEMKNKKTTTCPCNKTIEFLDGEILPAIPYESETNKRCHDCSIVPGGFHHPGCDVEICPRCGGQLISCDCWCD